MKIEGEKSYWLRGFYVQSNRNLKSTLQKYEDAFGEKLTLTEATTHLAIKKMMPSNIQERRVQRKRDNFFLAYVNSDGYFPEMLEEINEMREKRSEKELSSKDLENKCKRYKIQLKDGPKIKFRKYSSGKADLKYKRVTGNRSSGKVKTGGQPKSFD